MKNSCLAQCSSALVRKIKIRQQKGMAFPCSKIPALWHAGIFCIALFSNCIYRKTGRSPMILPILMEV